MTEEEIVSRCQTGDEQAFAELFHRYKVKAMRLAYAILGDTTLADDATQEAFIQAFRAIRNLRPGTPFAPWFYAILVRKARRLAARRRWRWLPLLFAQALPDPKTATAFDGAERSDVWNALQRLPVDLRIVVALRYVQDMNEAEMASLLQVPVGTVKSRLYRARKLLKRQLCAALGEEGHTWMPSMK